MKIDHNILNLALDPIINFGKVTLSTGYTSTDTTPITLNTGDGNKLPDPSIDGAFNLVWWNWSDYPDPSDDPKVEIVRVLARSGDNLSIMRSQEGTIASDKNIPGRIYKMVLSQTKKSIGDIQTDAQSRVDIHSALVTGIHGVGNDTVDGVSARNTAIATHSAVTSSVHNFDSSGNAPPQTHSKAKHDSTTVDGGAVLPSVIQIPPHGLAQHTGIIGAWAQIDKTTSNISDITTKSHTSLTDIGTTTHTQIDSHIGSTASVHNFDASGNAPPQTHGNAKHDSTTVDGGAALSSVSQILAHGTAQHTGTIGSWAQIDKTTSNIADIATKSHASLADIGTNTHASIDTHISSFTNIHGISAGLDASKPSNPIVGQRYIAVDTNKDYECYVAGTWRDITTTHSSLITSVHNFDASGNAPPRLHGLASHTGIIGDHQGNLTGIGTNTHTQIDSHIGSTASVHNFDASGNAPPQTHSKSRHDATTVDGGAALSLVTQIPVHGTAQHTGTIGSWGQIDKTVSSIADINTRSHSSLTDGAIPGTTNNHAAIDTAISNSVSHIAATTGIHGTTGNIVATGSSVSGQYSSAKYTTTTALNWNNGNVQYLQLAIGSQTFTFSNPRDGGRYMLILKQPGSGVAGTVIWPVNVLWSGGSAPTLTTTNGKVDLITFVYDGTNSYYYGGTSLNY